MGIYWDVQDVGSGPSLYAELWPSPRVREGLESARIFRQDPEFYRPIVNNDHLEEQIVDFLRTVMEFTDATV